MSYLWLALVSCLCVIHPLILWILSSTRTCHRNILLYLWHEESVLILSPYCAQTGNDWHYFNSPNDYRPASRDDRSMPKSATTAYVWTNLYTSWDVTYIRIYYVFISYIPGIYHESFVNKIIKLKCYPFTIPNRKHDEQPFSMMLKHLLAYWGK